MIKIFGFALAVTIFGMASGPAGVRPPEKTTASAPVVVPAGAILAQRLCGGCHAVGAGGSPLPEAPAFANLYRRYPAGCLEVMLSEGMLFPQHPPEEGAPRYHPRMPVTTLDDDQRTELIAYLRSLDPRPDPPEPRCERLPPAF